MKTYRNNGLELTPSNNVVFDKSDIDKRIADLNKTLSEKFRQNAEKEYQSTKIAKSFVTTV